jgi:hypothetical protein
MFARGLLPFHPARSPASGEFFLSPTIPALALSYCKSNYSHTYRLPRGGGIYRFPCQTNSPRSFTEARLSVLLTFRHLRTLSFSVAYLSPLPSMPFALFPQKRGGTTPIWSYQSNHSPPRHARPFPLPLPLPPFLPFPPFTAHSQSCYRPFTHLSPSLVTIIPSQGSTHTPCLSLSQCLRYTSTNASRPARSLHETRTHH